MSAIVNAKVQAIAYRHHLSKITTIDARDDIGSQ